MRRVGGGGGGGRSHGNYTNPCLTMHQPWASLLVYGIKRIEGRSWPAPIRGRLWIHAAGKVPEESTIKAMEDFYREIYAMDGIADIKFPEHYPVSRLLGCVEVVGCVRGEELANWKALPVGVRLEGQTDFCWLCENPQKLLIPFEMRGNQGVYNLEKKIYEAAVRGRVDVEGPMPVKFPLPDSSDLFSLKPGVLTTLFPKKKSSEEEKSSTLATAIAGARAATTQFNKKDQNLPKNVIQSAYPYSTRSSKLRGNSMEEKLEKDGLHEVSNGKSTIPNELERNKSNNYAERSSTRSVASAKIFAAAVKVLKPS